MVDLMQAATIDNKLTGRVKVANEQVDYDKQVQLMGNQTPSEPTRPPPTPPAGTRVAETKTPTPAAPRPRSPSRRRSRAPARSPGRPSKPTVAETCRSRSPTTRAARPAWPGGIGARTARPSSGSARDPTSGRRPGTTLSGEPPRRVRPSRTEAHAPHSGGQRPPDRPRRHCPAGLLACRARLAVSGCGTVKTSGTARTGDRATAADQRLGLGAPEGRLPAAAGVPVYLDTTNVTAVDQGWVVSSLRQAMLTQGVLLRPKPEQAQWIVEARVGAYGTDEYNWLLGIPQTTIPQTVTGHARGDDPRDPADQEDRPAGRGQARPLRLRPRSGQLVWNSGTMLATSTAKDVYVGGVGPIQSGSIRPRDRVRRHQAPAPLRGRPADPFAAKPRKARLLRPIPPTTPPPAPSRPSDMPSGRLRRPERPDGGTRGARPTARLGPRI